MICSAFPSYTKDIRSIIHIRRAGSISGQQMGQYMLECFRALGGRRLTGKVIAIENDDLFNVQLRQPAANIQASRIINAAGPFINDIAQMLGVKLPVKNILQQKIAFEDKAKAIPRKMPFSIDLDRQHIDWSQEERGLLMDDPDFHYLAKEMPGAIHCRPDGGDHGTWVKLGWAYTSAETTPSFSPNFSDSFPEIVLRGAACLNPALKTYYERLPRNMHHYGGYYTMTEENWPLIGPMGVKGAYVVGAMSGYGTMAACAAGELCADWITNAKLPDYANALSLARYKDNALTHDLRAQTNLGIL